MPLLLAADIGATNSRFALFSVTLADVVPHSWQLEAEQWFATADYANFAALAHAVLSSGEMPLVPPGTLGACLGIAGPICGTSCQPPNISWSIEQDEAARALGISQILLVNDFVALGHACLLACKAGPVREALRIRCIHPGAASVDPAAPLALVGAGSGCGKALILPRENLVLPSEGGHAALAFRAEEKDLADFLRKRCNSTPVVETLVSGSGLAALYAWHCGEELLPPEACARVKARTSTGAARVLEDFARFYGRACRNYALEILPLGGLYIGGGMASRLPVLEHPAFLSEFFESPRMSELLRAIPIYHIASQQAGLWGAAACGALHVQGK